MSYNDTLGKRSQQSNAGWNNDGGANDFAKKRDRKESALESNVTRDTACEQGSADWVPKDGEFESFPEIPEKSRDTLRAKGFKNLFPIQQNSFYPIYNRKDLIARDLTGSGKTYAFGLPLIEYLRKEKLLRSGRLQAIMLAPTRELAIQITNELSKMKHSPEEFRIVTVYGGVSVEGQAH